MINFRNSPFLWLALLLLASYQAAEVVAGFSDPWFRVAGYLLCCICGSLAVFKFSPQKQVWSTVLIAGLIFIAAILRLDSYQRENFKGDVTTSSDYIQGVFAVKQVLKNKNASVSLRAECITIFEEEENDITDSSDRFVLIFIKTVSPLQFYPGDIIRLEGWYSAIKCPLNPNAFDAREYYKSMGIRHQVYCMEENVENMGSQGFSIARITAKWQSSLTNIVRENTSPQVAQLTNALVWGDRSDMDSEVRDAFADSGAMHVLSVSGMHVAIIYTMLLFILGPPGAGSFFQRLTRFIIYTLAIIFYMGLTGACPAVVRAGLMIILYLFGKSMSWNTQVWNLLGFAAFVMLWINPYISLNIGFQLSFLAMAGILLFAKPMIRSISFRHKIIHYAWEITALSIVAQIFILPVLLSQFHQFPLTFIISSIVAIPAGYLVMLGAIVNTLLSFLQINFLWKALDFTGKIFIDIMQWMSGLNPEMHFSLPTVPNVMLMSMAVIFSFAVVFRWSFGKRIAWGFGITALLLLIHHRYREWTTNDLVVYHNTKGLLIDVIAEGKCYSIHDKHVPPISIEFAARNYRCERDIIGTKHLLREASFMHDKFAFEENILETDKISLLFWNDSIKGMDHQADIVIIDACKEPDSLKNFLSHIPAKSIILPAHLDRRLRQSIKDYLVVQGIPYHDVDEKGYYRLAL